MNKTTLGQLYLKELEAEAAASRHCLERVPEDKFDYKPHERSMPMGRLAFLVAEVPLWIAKIINDGVIDFETFKHADPRTAADLVKEFDSNMEEAKKVLEKVSDEDLMGTFILKRGDKILITETKLNMVSSTINHSVHHRGQLTVYLRLCGIPVPSIYGPSADEGHF